MHESDGSWEAHTRLAVLGAAEAGRTWLWRLNHHHGLVLDPEENVDSVRLRQDPYPAPPASLASWTQVVHALAASWARPPAATTRLLPSSTLPLSPAVTLMRWRLLASSLAPTSGPLTFLTSTRGNAYTALDISICSSHAQHAGADWTRSRLEAKCDSVPHLPSLFR